jgi:hypothetical protein
MYVFTRTSRLLSTYLDALGVRVLATHMSIGGEQVPRVRLSWARPQPLRASESSRSHLLVALQLILQLAERVFKAKTFLGFALGSFYNKCL